MPVPCLSVDQNTRNLFLKDSKLQGFALVADIENTYYCEPLTVLYERFKRGKAGPMALGRAAALREAADIGNAAGRLLSYLVALGRQGFQGTCVPQDMLGEAVTRATGKSTKERSIRAAQRALVAGGWISVHYTPTGSKTEIEPGLWRSLRICKISLTEQTKALFKGPKTYISIPRQKLPLMGCEVSKGGRNDSSPPCLPVDKDRNLEAAPGCSAVSSQGGEVAPTCPAVPTARPTVEHKPIGKKSAKKAEFFARRKRNRTPRSWDSNRLLFLRELAAALVGHHLARQLHHLAKVQTDKAFPPLIETALDWNAEIFQYHEGTAKQRRRRLRQIVIPALAAYAVGVFPPDTGPLSRADTPPAVRDEINRQLAAYERLRVFLGSISKRVIWGDYPDQVRDFARANAFALDNYPAMINAGRVELAAVPYETRNVFRQLADMINEGD